MPNFITIKIGALYYKIEYKPTVEFAVTFKQYVRETNHPIGYVFAPPPEPPLVPIGAIISAEATYPPLLPIEIPLPPAFPTAPALPPVRPIDIPPLLGPSGPVTPTVPVANRAFVTGSLSVGARAISLRNERTPIKVVTIAADEFNTAGVYVVSHPLMPIWNGFRIPPGGGVTLTIDDLSKVYVVAESGTQKIYYIAEM